MDWGNARVLVTGASGFIGGHLVERLVRAGAHVRALVRYNTGGLDRLPCPDAVEVVFGDVRDLPGVFAAAQGVDVVFHLAGLGSVPYSLQVPQIYLRVNIEGTLNVLQAARMGGGARVVYASSSAVYGTPQYTPVDEAHPLRAHTPYAASKIGAERFCESFYESFGLPVVIIRPFNTFGPRQSMRAVVPTIIAQCLGSGVVRMGDLHPTRDMNFVENMVEGFMQAAVSPRAVGQVINLCSGEEIGIGALVRLVARLTGREVRIETEAARFRSGEIDRLVGDGRRARDLLGWAPAVSLEDGLLRTIDWVRRDRSMNREQRE